MLRIVLPFPPKELFPNFKRRHHWSRYSGPTKRYRETCWALALKTMVKADGCTSIPMHVDFYPPDARRRDDDGMIGAFKAGRDGIAHALKVDDHVFQTSYGIHPPVKGGRVIVRIG